MKGIFMLLIYLIHAFQATLSPEGGLVSGIYIFNYMLGAPICLAVIIVWWMLTFKRFGPDFEEMRIVMGYTYACPDLWHTIASMAHILLLAAISFFICDA